jgi:hypothetical protein
MQLLSRIEDAEASEEAFEVVEGSAHVDLATTIITQTVQHLLKHASTAEVLVISQENARTARVNPLSIIPVTQLRGSRGNVLGVEGVDI